MGDNVQEILIDQFNGGISDDVRLQIKNQFAVSQHFDIYSNPARLSPYRSFEDAQDDGVVSATGMKQYEVQNFWPSNVSGRLYGLGKQTSFSRPKIFYKTDPTDSSWTLPATAEGGAALVKGCFFEWASCLWMFSGSTNVSKWTVGSTFTDTAMSTATAINGVAQGIVSPTDNNAYMFYYTTADLKSHVVRITSAAVLSDDVLPLPVGYRVKSACLWGNYIAIALVTGGAGGANKSIVILWDPVLDNFSEIIDFGDGEINSIENVEGSICAFIDGTMSNLVSVTGGTFVVRMWGGGAVQTVKSVKNTTIISSGLFGSQKILKDFRMYVSANLTFNGATYIGVWSFGRKGPSYPFALTCALSDNANSPTVINGFSNMGDYWFLAENSDGTIRKTNDQATFSETSILESQKYNGGRFDLRKLLHSVFVTTVPLPAAGQIVLKYRKDEETAYTTLFTETTDNNILTELGAASGVSLPEFKEIQFRVESTGGAEITSWGFRFTTLDGATTPES